MEIWKKAKDNLMNGAIFGALVGLAFAYGDKVTSFIQKLLPDSLLIFGSFSLAIYTVAIFTLIGYFLDRY